MTQIQIGANYPTQWSRREPDGLYWPVNITSSQDIRAVELSMEGDGSEPFRLGFFGRKDGRWFRGLAWKPEINGTWWPLVKAFETWESKEPLATQRGPHKVTVTDDPLDLKGSLPFPIRAAFYYPCFPEWWASETRYTPRLGRYDSARPDVIDAHVRALEYGRFHAGIASWWGQGSDTDRRLPLLLAGSEGYKLRWAIYHEMEGYGKLTVEQIRIDLTYIRDRYASHPNYLRVSGRFVVFVYNADDSDCSLAQRWRAANTVGAHLVLKVVGGFADCADQPGDWHQYGPDKAAQSLLPYSYNISPGFQRPLDPVPLLARDLTRWKQNVRDMVASEARWQLATSFNEWPEGTVIEGAKEWESASGYGAYLDVLHELVPAFNPSTP